MSDENKVDRNELFFLFLDKDIAELARQQWETDGRPDIYSLAICQEYDHENNELIQFIEPYYIKDVSEDVSEEDNTSKLNSQDSWYNQMVDKLNNGEI